MFIHLHHLVKKRVGLLANFSHGSIGSGSREHFAIPALLFLPPQLLALANLKEMLSES